MNAPAADATNAKPSEAMMEAARALRPDERCHCCSRMASERNPLMLASGRWVCAEWACAKAMRNAGWKR